MTHPNNRNLSNLEYREFIDKIALAYVHQANPDYSTDSIEYICANLFGNWYKINELEIGLKYSQTRLKMYQNMHIPKEWFKCELNHLHFNMHIDNLIKDTEDLIKDYQDLIGVLTQEENNNESSK